MGPGRGGLAQNHLHICLLYTSLPAHHWKYRDYSRRVNAVYERYTDLVEPFSIDESWLDITGSLHLFG